jgi:DNA mismatch endonuclease (patch repair protein)
MTDVVDKEKRSQMMAAIKGKNTKPEMSLRTELHRLGFRYRLHSKLMIGQPDLVFPRFRAAVFVHGCFWHRHPNCRYATTPKTHESFWFNKFQSNINRDGVVRKRLLAEGWRIAIVWECALRRKGSAPIAASQLAKWLESDVPELEIGDT